MNPRDDQRAWREELCRLLERASVLAAAGCDVDDVSASQAGLREQVAALEAENLQLAEQMAELEARNHQMLGLYVATYQLYDSRDPEHVLDTIAEITRDILGAERFAVVLRQPGSKRCRVVMRHGLTNRCPPELVAELYVGGLPELDIALEDGTRYFSAETEPFAVVPLRLNSETIGALVILGLLSHKKMLTSADSEILDLLGAHSASALMASESWSLVSRKLETLESLIELARGSVP